MSEFLKKIELGRKTAGNIVGQEELAWYHNNFNQLNNALDIKLKNNSNLEGQGASNVYAGGAVSWLNTAVNRKMSDITNMDVFFVDKRGQKIEWSEVPQELRMAFDSRYAGMSINELLGYTIGHEDLSGNILWLKNSDGSYDSYSGRVERLVPILPGFFKINLNQRGTAIESYTIKFKDGTFIDVNPDQVLHFKRNPMINPFVGIGLVSQGRATVDYLGVSSEYQLKFLEKDGTPDLIYIDKNVSDPNTAKAKAAQLRADYKAGKYSNSLMYAAGEIDIKSFSISSADMQYIENKKLGKYDIIALMESTPGVLGDESAAGNKSVTGTSSLNYYKNVNSRMDHAIEIVNSQHVWTIKGNQKKIYTLSYTPYPVGDIDQITKAIDKGLLKPAHGSKELGYEYSDTDEASNTLYITAGLRPIDQVLESTPIGTLNDPNGDVKKNSITRSRITCKHWFDLSHKELYTFDEKSGRNVVGARSWQMPYLEKGKRAQEKTSKKYKPDLKNFLNSQAERIAERLNNIYHYKAPDSMIDPQDVDKVVEIIFQSPYEDQALKDTIKPLHTSGIIKQAEIANALTGAQILASIGNPEVQAALSRLGNKITRVNDTTKEMLRDLVNTGIKNGDNVLTIAQNIRQTGIDEWYQGRALAIAQTESRYAADAGGRMVYRELKIEKFDVIGCVGTLGVANQFGLTASYGDMSEDRGACGLLEVEMGYWDEISGAHHPNHQGVMAPSYIP